MSEQKDEFAKRLNDYIMLLQCMLDSESYRLVIDLLDRTLEDVRTYVGKTNDNLYGNMKTTFDLNKKLEYRWGTFSMDVSKKKKKVTISQLLSGMIESQLSRIRNADSWNHSASPESTTSSKSPAPFNEILFKALRSISESGSSIRSVTLNQPELSNRSISLDACMSLKPHVVSALPVPSIVWVGFFRIESCFKHTEVICIFCLMNFIRFRFCCLMKCLILELRSVCRSSFYCGFARYCRSGFVVVAERNPEDLKVHRWENKRLEGLFSAQEKDG